MGLAYGMLLITIAGAAMIAFLSLKTIKNVWKKPEKRLLMIILFPVAGVCIVVAVYLAVLIWQSPPWSFFF